MVSVVPLVWASGPLLSVYSVAQVRVSLRAKNFIFARKHGGTEDCSMNLTHYIKTKAVDIGFDLVGITTAEPIRMTDRRYFEQWLFEGKAGDMAYLYRNMEKRFDPSKLLIGARSIVCVAVKYDPCSPLNTDCRIATFALYEDYHKAVKKNLTDLAKSIASLNLNAFDYKVCVDSVPLAERALAQRAGLGFIGKNHMLINPTLGNSLLLGELITTLTLQPDKPLKHSGCGDCGRCIDACPTGALGPQGDFDARRCISYMTIENKADIDMQYASKLKGYIFGCDECLNACPHSACGKSHSSPLLKARPEWRNLTRQQIMAMTDAEFESFFADSGLLRLGRERLVRNCRSGE